jgi:hypothetical protein
VFKRWIDAVRLCDFQDKVKVHLLCRSAKAIAAVAHQHDDQAARVAWTSWLQEGPAKGLGRQHKMSRVAHGWIPSKVGDASQSDSCDDEDCIDDLDGLTEDDISREASSLVP